MKSTPIKQIQAMNFNKALNEYREALKAKDEAAIIPALHFASINKQERAALNRSWKECCYANP